MKNNFPKIKDITTGDELDELMNFIITILNIKINSDEESDEFKDMERQMIFTVDLLKKKFWHLSTEEVKEAFRMLAARELPVKPFRLLDCLAIGETLYAFIEFRNGRLSADVHRKPTTPVETKSLPVKMPAAIDEKLQLGVNRVFSEYIESGILGEGLLYIYEFLVEKGLIKLATGPKSKKYYDDKIDEAVAQLSIEKTAEEKNVKDRLDLAKIQAIREAKLAIEAKTTNEVYIRAAKLVLKDFFDSRIKLGQTFIFEYQLPINL